MTVVVMLVPHRGLEAGPTAGTLSLTQRAAPFAPIVTVRYIPAATMANASRVTLKVATYAARKPGPSVNRNFTLIRGRDGVFVADVELPAGTVFAQYSVASVDGTKVDDNDARGWELAVRDSAARPLFEGLWIQRVLNGFGNWERSYAAAKAMMRYYPANPNSIRMAMYDDREIAGASRADSIVNLYRPRVEALHRTLVSAPLDATTMWEMAMLGDAINDTAIVRHWRLRMTREFPTDGGTIQQRVFAMVGERLPAHQMMQALDQIWDETGGQSIQLLAEAFNLSARLNDGASIARWGERLIRYGGGYESIVSSRYVTIPALRARGAELLRAGLHALPPVLATDWRAALHNVDGRSSGQQGQWQLQLLGSALLDEGRIGAARDTLRRAASLGWDAKTLRTLGDAELAAGDSAAGMTAYAWVVADPRTSRERGDTLRGQLGNTADVRRWDAAVAEGRALVTAMTLRTAIHRSFDARASFSNVSGIRRSMATVLGKRVSIVAFISRQCAPSIADFASLDAVAAKLAQRGVPLVALVDEKPDAAAIAELGKRGFKGRVGFDDRAEVSRGMRQSGTPHYLVIEYGNVIRFTARKAEDLLMFVEVLQAKR